MSLFAVMDLARSGMTSQSIRLNTVASNLANAQTVAGSEKDAYHSKQPVFKTIKPGFSDVFSMQSKAAYGVEVTRIAESEKQAKMEYRPDHPLADENGYVYLPNVNTIEEMTDMISASRSYQTCTNLFDMVRQQILQTINLGNM